MQKPESKTRPILYLKVSILKNDDFYHRETTVMEIP